MAVGTIFDGVDDRIISTTGNDITIGAYTWGALLHLEGITGLDTWFSYDNAGTAAFAPFTNGTTLGIEHTGGTSSQLVAAFPNWGGWHQVWITKATGTAAPVAHIFNGVSWVHTAMGTAIANPGGALSEINLGAYSAGDSDFSDGDAGWFGLWGEDTNNATIETYLNFSTLSSKANAAFFTGTSLLNGGTMTDSAGGNNETSRVGATTGVRHLPAWQTNFHTRSLPGVTLTTQFSGTTGQPTEVLPAGATTGDLVIVHGATDTATTQGVSSGWTQLFNAANGTAVRLGAWARVLDGSGDDTLAITLGGGTNTNDFVYQAHLIPAALHGCATAADIETSSANAPAASAAPDGLTVSWTSGDRYVMTFFAADDDDTTNIYMPANYAGIRQTISATGTTGCTTASAFREVTGTTSENPGAFALAASEEWVAGTIAIRGPVLSRPSIRQPARQPNNLWVPRGRGRSNRSR